MGDQLADFIRSRREKASSSDTDWPARKDAWVRSVEDLYTLVEELLSGEISSKDVEVQRFDMEVAEDFAGTYSIPALALTVGRERVEFRPKGMNVIGAAGRVDIRGEGDTVSLLKDEHDINGGWTVVLQRVPRLQRIPLSRESLKHALERVMLPLP